MPGEECKDSLFSEEGLWYCLEIITFPVDGWRERFPEKSLLYEVDSARGVVHKTQGAGAS